MEQHEWLQQRMKVASGEATWDDFTFEERSCKGFLLPYLFEIDSMFSGRWDYWTDTLGAKKLLGPIPKIDFFESPEHETMKMLRKCLEDYVCYRSSVHLSDFLHWILWGLGAEKERARIESDVNEFWYRTFNLGLLLKNPHDYWGEILADAKSGGSSYWNNPNAFYPTPHSLVQVMVQMTMGGDDGRDKRVLSVLDPCVGTGRFLMYASNYSLNLYGNDIDRVCVMACTINAYLYMPWLVKPASWLKPEGMINLRKLSGKIKKKLSGKIKIKLGGKKNARTNV